MGQKLYGVISGTGGNGQTFYTAQSEAINANVYSAAATLEVAVSTSLLPYAAVSITGTNSASIYTALSAAYATAKPTLPG